VSSLRFVLSVLAAAAALALHGCDPFNPTYDQLLCTGNGECPNDMICSEGVCLSESAQLCGDGQIVGTEVCDDGNLADGDGCSASCTAATCYIPVTHQTLASGLADQACPTLYLHTGVYAERISLGRAVTVVGVGSLPPILDGEAGGTVVSVEMGTTATLRRLVIRNGRAENGAGVRNQGTLVLDGVTVLESTAAGELPRGGGIANLGGALTLISSEVTRNHVEKTGAPGLSQGAGIFSDGGTVRIDGGSAIVANDIVQAGQAGQSARGAGIAAAEAAITITGESAVRGNLIDLDGLPNGGASAAGAGLYLQGGSLTVNAGSLVEDNSASAKGTEAGGGGGGVSAIGGGLVTDATVITFDTAMLRNNKVVATGNVSASASGGGARLGGGSIQIAKTAITGNSVRVEGPLATSDFSSASSGGLALNNVTGTVSESSISANTVTVDNKGTSGFALVNGGGVSLDSFGTSSRSVFFSRCTIDGNTLTATAASRSSAGGGIYASLGTGTAVILNVNVTSSAITNNVTQGNGGGVSGDTSTGDTTLNINLVNTTISGNLAGGGGGGIYGSTGTGSAKVNVVLASATITANTATTGGGMLLRKGISSSMTTGRSRSSIVGGNAAATDPDCSNSGSTLTSQNYNLLSVPGTCVFSGEVAGDRIGPAGLGPLANNGGGTLTHALLGGSQALDSAGPSCFDPVAGNILTTDQRGLPRIAGARCDIGAFEQQ
jgi:cysteine-rich repeat protein